MSTLGWENREDDGKAGESPGALCAKAIHFRPQCGRLRERELTLFCPRELSIDACFGGKAEKCRCYGISADAIVKTAVNGGPITCLEERNGMQRGENGGATKSACEPLCARLVSWIASVPPLKAETPCRGFVGLLEQRQKGRTAYIKICDAKQRIRACRHPLLK